MIARQQAIIYRNHGLEPNRVYTGPFALSLLLRDKGKLRGDLNILQRPQAAIDLKHQSRFL